MSDLQVIVIGAGLGGLTLAQFLRQSGIGVQVFERDKGPWDRPQGYRLYINPDGARALFASLPKTLFELFDATAMKALPYNTIVNTSFDLLRRMEIEDGDNPFTRIRHVNINRATLREILLTGLGDVVHFGEKLAGFENSDLGVTAVFESGRRVSGDILVGADGIHSAVRRQRLPEAQVMDTGVRAIYGRIPIDAARKHAPPQALADVFTVAADENKVFFGLGPVIFPIRPDLASKAFMPEADLKRQDDYVVSIVGGRQELFGLSDANLRKLDSKALRALAGDLLEEWPKPVRSLPGRGDPRSFFLVDMLTSLPLELPASANVTLLGDAIHAMTPTLGRGANVAMRDAGKLGLALKEVAAGGLPLGDALKAYEAQMTDYGFDVVRESAQMGARLMGQKPLPG